MVLRQGKAASPVRYPTITEAKEAARKLSEKHESAVCILESVSFIRHGETKFIEFEPF